MFSFRLFRNVVSDLTTVLKSYNRHVREITEVSSVYQIKTINYSFKNIIRYC